MGRKPVFKEGDTVYWTCASGFVRSGQIMKFQEPFAIILVSGGQRRWVRIEALSNKKL